MYLAAEFADAERQERVKAVRHRLRNQEDDDQRRAAHEKSRQQMKVPRDRRAARCFACPVCTRMHEQAESMRGEPRETSGAGQAGMRPGFRTHRSQFGRHAFVRVRLPHGHQPHEHAQAHRARHQQKHKRLSAGKQPVQRFVGLAAGYARHSNAARSSPGLMEPADRKQTHANAHQWHRANRRSRRRPDLG